MIGLAILAAGLAVYYGFFYRFGPRIGQPKLAPKATAVPDAQKAITNLLGPRLLDYQYNEAAGVITVTWLIEDILTEDLTRSGARRDATDILRKADTSSTGFETITMIGMFAMQDTFGNVSEQNVVALTFQRATIDKINWSNFLPENIYTIADVAKIHPAFDQ